MPLHGLRFRVGEMTGAKNREAEVNQALGVLLKENSELAFMIASDPIFQVTRGVA